MRISTDKDCNIIITDDTEYPVNGLNYEDSISIYIVLLNESDNTTTLYHKIDNHKNSDGKSIKLNPTKGGYMTACHIILPVEDVNDVPTFEDDDNYVKKVDFIANEGINELFQGELPIDLSELEPHSELTDPHLKYADFILLNRLDEIILSSDGKGNENPAYSYYFFDGKNIYRRNYDLSATKVTEQELIDVNPKVFGLRIFTLNFFSVCFLRKCYISLNQKIFNDRGFDRCFNGKVNSQLIYKRDLVWAALNTIQYMIDSNLFTEAQRLLERINGCNGLCSQEDTGELNCGCK